MPRHSNGPHLWLDKKRDRWTIIDKKRRNRTGFTSAQIEQAKAALQKYLAESHVVPAKDSNPPIADVLSAYLDEHLDLLPSGQNTKYNVGNLAKWWGTKRLAQVTAANCIAYAGTKNTPGARNDLKVLRAAINHWHNYHGPLPSIPPVKLPQASPARERWLTRSEAAAFLWHARRTPRLARFFLIGWYTGSRSKNIYALRWDMIDFKSQVMKRREAGKAESHKRTPPVRIGDHLMAHLRRWRDMDQRELALLNADRQLRGEETLSPCPYVVHWRRQKVGKLQKCWPDAVEKAGLGPDVTPHVLRHSRATHLMRNGVSVWEAAKSLGMTAEMVERVYGHHHPDWQKAASQVR